MADHLEIEQKFDADPDLERPDFAAVTAGVAAAAPVLHHLSATYFDTADGRLQAAKITLRRRTGGTDAGWHLKLPAGQPSPDAAPLPDGVSARRLPETSAEPLRWREIEVEVPAADPELQQALADRLLAAGARPAGHGSKLGRLLSA